jgi:hypothetical protein
MTLLKQCMAWVTASNRVLSQTFQDIQWRLLLASVSQTPAHQTSPVQDCFVDWELFTASVRASTYRCLSVDCSTAIA